MALTTALPASRFVRVERDDDQQAQSSIPGESGIARLLCAPPTLSPPIPLL
ncbi:hypothetical protein HJFPF1_12711 [Paramyrothecium foliicola]|nr:hypothetical protein HJFPF1_12711 [Paramyrothecium foliicola]